MAKAKKKPNAQDATLRNVRAARKRIDILTGRVGELETRNLKFGDRIQRLEEQARESERTFSLLEEQFKNSLTPPA